MAPEEKAPPQTVAGLDADFKTPIRRAQAWGGGRLDSPARRDHERADDASPPARDRLRNSKLHGIGSPMPCVAVCRASRAKSGWYVTLFGHPPPWMLGGRSGASSGQVALGLRRHLLADQELTPVQFLEGPRASRSGPEERGQIRHPPRWEEHRLARPHRPEGQVIVTADETFTVAPGAFQIGGE